MGPSAKISVSLFIFCCLVAALPLGCNSGSSDVSGTGPGPGGSLSWTPPTLYSDGSSLASSDIKEYRVYWRTETGSYSPENRLVVSTQGVSVDLSRFNLPAGKYYIAVTAVDQSDMESDYSAEIPVN